MAEYILAQSLLFLELHPTMSLDLPASPVLEPTGSRYNIILGQEYLKQARMTIFFVHNTISMLESTSAMRKHKQLIELQDPQDLYLQMQDTLHGSFDDK
jgi:hypothetical protein